MAPPRWVVAVALLLELVNTAAAWKRCNVMEYGAVGDGQANDTAAFREAIAACTGGGTVVVPPKRFATEPFNLTTNTALEVQAGGVILGMGYTSIQLPPLPTMGGSVAAGGGGGAGSKCRYSPLIGAYNATNVTLFGGGNIDGRGQQFWSYKDHGPCRKPMLLEFWYVHGLTIRDIGIHNSPFWNIHPYMSHDIHIHHINITADFPANAHFNTDGIDPDSCTNVLIEDYYYCAGDDAIAIKSGWNIAGMLYGKPSRNITVRRSSSGCRGGWTLGSEAAGGIEDVVFEDLVSTSESGIRISGEIGRGGFVRNVTFRNLTFNWATLEKKTFLFEVSQTYPNGGTNAPCVYPNGTASDLHLDLGQAPIPHCTHVTYHVAHKCVRGIYIPYIYQSPLALGEKRCGSLILRELLDETAALKMPPDVPPARHAFRPLCDQWFVWC